MFIFAIGSTFSVEIYSKTATISTIVTVSALKSMGLDSLLNNQSRDLSPFSTVSTAGATTPTIGPLSVLPVSVPQTTLPPAVVIPPPFSSSSSTSFLASRTTAQDKKENVTALSECDETSAKTKTPVVKVQTPPPSLSVAKVPEHKPVPAAVKAASKAVKQKEAEEKEENVEENDEMSIEKTLEKICDQSGESNDELLPAVRGRKTATSVAASKMFYSPDREDETTGEESQCEEATEMLEEEESVEEEEETGTFSVAYVPPFNNPLYPNSNQISGFVGSVIGEFLY